MNTLIRPRTDTDIPALAQILVRVHAQDGYPVEGVENPQSWLIPPRELAAWTAISEDHPIGHISITQASDTDETAREWQRITGRNIAELAIPVRLFIDPHHRHQGAGEQLMLTAQKFAATKNMAIAFDVMLKDQDAIRLYERAGCTRISVITHHHSNGKHEPAAIYTAPELPNPTT